MGQVFTGDTPFSGHLSTEVIVLVLRGKRPRKPTHPTFTEDLWSLMQCCWDHDRNSRPTASEVLGTLEVVTRRPSGDCTVKIDPRSVSHSTARGLGMCSNLPVNTGLTFAREAFHGSNTESGSGGAEGVPTVLGMGRRIRGEDTNTGTHSFPP